MRIIQRWETSIDLRYSWLYLFSFLLGLVILAHWGACGWKMVVFFQDTPEEESWIGV